MSVASVRYAPTLSSAGDTNRGPSPALWRHLNIPEILESPRWGMHFFEDFLMAGSEGAATGGAVAANFGQWGVYGSQGSVSGDLQLEGGAISLTSDGDQEGMTLMSTAGAFRLLTTSTLALNGLLVFEARVARSTVTDDKLDAFVGLCTPSQTSNLPTTAIPISTTDATMSTTPSFIGFHSVDKAAVTYGDARDYSLVFNLASGTVNAVTNLTTVKYTATGSYLAADEFVKLGFVFDPAGLTKQVSSATARQTAGQLKRALLRVFVNGIELPTFLTTDDIQNATAGQAFPTGFLAPCIAMMNTTGSSPGSFKADWIRVAQRANS